MTTLDTFSDDLQDMLDDLNEWREVVETRHKLGYINDAEYQFQLTAVGAFFSLLKGTVDAYNKKSDRPDVNHLLNELKTNVNRSGVQDILERMKNPDLYYAKL